MPRKKKYLICNPYSRSIHLDRLSITKDVDPKIKYLGDLYFQLISDLVELNKSKFDSVELTELELFIQSIDIKDAIHEIFKDDYNLAIESF